jgi:hypothetical protein
VNSLNDVGQKGGIEGVIGEPKSYSRVGRDIRLDSTRRYMKHGDIERFAFHG